jgi:nanoRNase/pAp phosphatase (c-di-AMP/oligoRNAs hydrolase)
MLATPDDLILVLKEGSSLIFTHQHADMDALGCALALRDAFPGTKIAEPVDLDRVAKNFVKKESILFDASDSPSDTIIFVDTSEVDTSSCDGCSNIMVIDHHAKVPELETREDVLYLCDEGKGSCVEIIHEMITASGQSISATSAKAMLLGILTDTGRFKHAPLDSMRTFIDISDKHGISMQGALSYLSYHIAKSQAIAQLKSCQRLQFEEFRGMFIGSSVISSFEGGVAGALLSAGLGVALVGSQREHEFRISGRATREALADGVHLGRIFKDVSVVLGATGGGHDGAASISGTGDVEAAIGICKKHVKDAISAYKAKATADTNAQ